MEICAPEKSEQDENTAKQNSAELLIIGDDGPVSSKTSLQENFKKFRSQKIKEKKLMNACRSGALSGGRTPEFKEALRHKFVEQAKRYLGVPYGEKYKKEEDPVAPLYLDCCALVRRAVQDLQDEFGFVIGKWNQAYQMDTLPIVLTEDQLKPGDLIFYEGTYTSPRAKEQKHNNVHVEIFVGGETGEGTLGARWHRGVVSFFPSYKFEASSWTIHKYHFRSLDTWLDGICKSHCDEHPWHSDALNYLEAAGKRSIFNAEEDEDCSAGGDDDDDFDEKEAATVSASADTAASNSSSDALLSPKLSTSEPQVAPTVQQGGMKETGEGQAGPEEGKGGGGASTKGTTTTTTSNSSGSGATSASKSAKSTTAVSVSGSSSAKKPKRVSAYATAGGGATGAAVGTGSSKDSSNPVKRTSEELDKSMSALSQKSNKEGGARSYYLGKANGWKLVRKAMDRRGWTMMPSEYHFSNRYGFKWVERRNQIDYIAHTPGQLVCHIPNNDCVTTKIGLLATMRDKYCRQTSSSNPTSGASAAAARTHPPWLPHTYDLESPADCMALLAEEERLASGAGRPRHSSSASTSTATSASASTSAAAVPVPAAAADGGGGTGQVQPPRSPAPERSTPTTTAAAAAAGGALIGGDDDDDAEDESGEAEDIAADGASAEPESTTSSAESPEAEQPISGISGGIWIYKPSCANRGRGIRVVTGMDKLKELVTGQPMGSDPDGVKIPYKGIVQKYIRNPLLLTPEGYKFDIRVYLLIARNFPTTLAFYHPGYVRMALKPYDVSTKEALEDDCVHLTNASVQKKHDVYKADGNKEAQVQTIEAVADGLDECGKHENASFMREQLDHHIKLCLVDILKASNHIFVKRHGYFDLLGCDFMISTTNKLSLLEVNTNPALTLDNSTLANMLPEVVDNTIELVMQSQGPDRKLSDPDDFLKEPLPGRFQLIFDEGTGYMYKPTRKSKAGKSSKTTKASATK